MKENGCGSRIFKVGRALAFISVQKNGVKSSGFIRQNLRHDSKFTAETICAPHDAEMHTRQEFASVDQNSIGREVDQKLANFLTIKILKIKQGQSAPIDVCKR